jgi:hypothetical protein
MPRSPDDDQKPYPDSLFGEQAPEEEASREGRGAGFVPEFVRKVAVAGLGALFMTEEGIRSLAGQLKLPKEMLGYIVGQAEKTKDEVGRVLSEEIRGFLQSDKLREEFLKLLASMTIEVKAEVRLKPREPGEPPSEPEVTISEIGTRRSSKKKKE